MAKSKGTRLTVTLECTECRKSGVKRLAGVSRYTTKKNRKNTPERIELKNSAVIVINIKFIKKLNNY